MYLSKTDFLDYLKCSKNLWTKKKKPDLYIEEAITDFDLKNIREGQEVESLARELFPEGILLNGKLEELAKETKQLIELKKSPIFQATFITDKNLLAKLDILVYDENSDSWDIYEVKSSNEIKNDRDHNHTIDVTFQKITLEATGVRVGKTYIIHLNRDYKKNGDLNIEGFFISKDITDEVNKIYDSTKSEIEKAMELLSKDSIELTSCDCLYLTRTNHCSSFGNFNPDVPDYSIHDISRIGPSKIKDLTDLGILTMGDIPDDFSLTDNQRNQVHLEKSQVPNINSKEIAGIVDTLEYPLYFLDYETYNPAVPILDGFSPYQHICFQVSIHILNSDGDLQHHEYLADKIDGCVLNLISFLQSTISPVGTIVSWHATFENTINKQIAEIYPEHHEFLHGLISRTFDLEKIFKKDYLHPGFRGRSTIKKVLPVLIPELSYEELDIQGGTEAMVNWQKMIFKDLSEPERNQIKKSLLEYCKMDTLAMVKIFQHL